jgi:hypothetical protein
MVCAGCQPGLGALGQHWQIGAAAIYHNVITRLSRHSATAPCSGFEPARQSCAALRHAAAARDGAARLKTLASISAL